MMVSGIGIAILFGSNQGIILSNTPYPPFGIFTVSFFGLASIPNTSGYILFGHFRIAGHGS
jgi:hypothetical protein